MRREKLPLGALSSWSRLNNLEIHDVILSDLQNGRGIGVIATCDMSDPHRRLMTIPRELILSKETVWGYAKYDEHLREVLEVAGEFGRTSRGAILIFLLIQITSTSLDMPVKIGASNPWTDYIKFLPDPISLPIFWTESERELLNGTSLEPATDAKLRSLDREFAELRVSTGLIQWCAEYWWDAETGHLSVEDWKIVDAMYRSRAMELPIVGLSMVPVVDMCNHSSGPGAAAYYNVDENGNGILVLDVETELKLGDEVNISYGDAKGACEMLFSYGFIEESMRNAISIFLGLEIPEDDPLRFAKKAAFDLAPGFRVYDFQDDLRWAGDYVWLSCINEEDGLEFLVAQTIVGGKELNVEWKGKQIQDISHLLRCMQYDYMWNVFQLRGYTTVSSRVQEEIEKRLALDEEDEADGVASWNLDHELTDMNINEKNVNGEGTSGETGTKETKAVEGGSEGTTGKEIEDKGTKDKKISNQDTNEKTPTDEDTNSKSINEADAHFQLTARGDGNDRDGKSESSNRQPCTGQSSNKDMNGRGNVDSSASDSMVRKNAALLKRLELKLLRQALDSFEFKQNDLFGTEGVRRYLAGEEPLNQEKSVDASNYGFGPDEQVALMPAEKRDNELDFW